MTHRIVKPSIAERFINEVPRFFGGWLATLREVFQNAYRAGATEVQVTLDATQTILTITDNGRGCPEAEALMCIGRSDWDETQVVEAAGLGFLSVLNGALVERVTARSASWRGEWKCTAKELASARVFDAEPVTGFSLMLYLKEQHPELKDEIRQARSFYPYKVVLNDEVIEPLTVKHDLRLDTPVGVVYFKEGDYHDSRAHTAVWEWRDLKSNAFADELNTAFQRQPACLRRVYDTYPQFTWFVDPVCGVTPKLPDRNDLQVDVHLKAACQIIVQALCDHARELITAYADSLPDTVTEVKGLNRYIDQDDVRLVMCDLLGWSRLHVDNYAGYSVCWENSDDGPGTYPTLEFDRDDYDVLVRNSKSIVINRADAYTITNWLLQTERTLGLRYATEEELKAGRLEGVKIVGKKWHHGSMVATARRITWRGEELPFYLNGAGGLGVDDGPVLVLSGSVAQMMKTYTEYADVFRGWLLRAAEDEGYLCDYTAEDFGEWSADIDAIDDALQPDILKYGPRQLQIAQQREMATRTVLAALRAAERKLADVPSNLKVGETLDGQLPRLKKQLAAAKKKYQAEQQRLAAFIEQQTA
jgi:hypothetical protein